MIEQILTRKNLLQGMRKVQKNHGSSGVDHSYLLQLLYDKVKCQQILRLIRKWLRSPIQINGRLVKRRKGIPQGSPLSPLLANIMLHELDRELERQDCRFVRYAADFCIYT